jgi:hypothetical protein
LRRGRSAEDLDPDFVILHRDKIRALGACFADMPSLEVTGENHVGVLVENALLMNMTERPVIVTLGDEFIERTGCVIRMATHAADAGVQDANVESAVNRLRVRRDQIVGNVALPEALAVKRNAIGWSADRRCHTN